MSCGHIFLRQRYYVNIDIVFYISIMASPSVYCVGCGCDITNSKGNRLIRSTSSRHVVPLWSSLMKEEIDSRETSLVAQSLIDDDGRMCRQC